MSPFLFCPLSSFSVYRTEQALERGQYLEAGLSALGAVSGGLNLRAPTGTFFPSVAKLPTATTLTKVEAAVFRASELAQAGLLTYQAYEKVQEGKFGEAFISGLQAGFSAYSFMLACFAGEMPIKTTEGSKRADQVQQWDFLLAKNEFDPDGPVEPKLVEEVFVRNGRIFHVHIHDRVIRTTPEHPFYVKGKGWVPAGELEIGDLIGSSDGRWHPVEDLFDTGEYETVYNFRVAEYHTYFVGCEEWGFDVWAHNACTAKNVQKAVGETLESGEARYVAGLLNKGEITKAMSYFQRKGINTAEAGVQDLIKQNYWPPNSGFLGESATKTLRPGAQKVTRYGGFIDEAGEFKDLGTFTGPQRVSFPARALPAESLRKPYSVYDVVKPIENVKVGLARPWHG